MIKKIVYVSIILIFSFELVSAPVEWMWPKPWGGNTNWGGPGRWNGSEGDEQKVIALTFDDGPSEYTERVLDILAKYEAPATFFVMGVQAEKYPELIKRMTLSKHEIGNHGYDFVAQANKLYSSMDLGGIAKTQDIIGELSGFKPKFFRSPGGQMGRQYFYAIRENDLEVVNGILPMPHPKLSGDEQLAIAKTTITPGAVIILHDGDDGTPDSDRPQATIEMLGPLLEEVKAKGYRVVGLSRILGR